MKVSKTLLTFLILIVAIQQSAAQDQPYARLVDEIGPLPCGDVLQRVDNFMTEIQESPGSIGYAVIYPQRGKILEASERKTWIAGNIAFRGFYKDRFLVIRGEERENLQVQFWLVPSGAAKPEFSEQKWSYATKDINKAFVFSTFEDYLLCPGNYIGSYVDFLTDNPDTRGHIVIFNGSGRYDRAEAESILKDLTDDGRLKRNRLKVFFAKQNVIPNTELWVVPLRKTKAATGRRSSN